MSSTAAPGLKCIAPDQPTGGAPWITNIVVATGNSLVEITQVSEVDLEKEAVAQGPTSPAATILAALAKKRAKDRQVFAWQVGSYYFVGPPPDAEMEALIRDFVDTGSD